jgi:hypothetical protein
VSVVPADTSGSAAHERAAYKIHLNPERIGEISIGLYSPFFEKPKIRLEGIGPSNCEIFYYHDLPVQESSNRSERSFEHLMTPEMARLLSRKDEFFLRANACIVIAKQFEDIQMLTGAMHHFSKGSIVEAHMLVDASLANFVSKEFFLSHADAREIERIEKGFDEGAISLDNFSDDSSIENLLLVIAPRKLSDFC